MPITKSTDAKIGKHGQKILVQSDDFIMIELEESAGAKSDTRSNDFTLTGYVLSGKLTLTIDGVAHELASGDSFLVPPGTPYSHHTVEECKTLEVAVPFDKSLGEV